MSNTLANSTLVTKKALAILVNMLKFTKFVNRDFEGEFGNQGGYMSGQTIQIRKPPRYNIRAGKVAVPQATVETTIPLTLAQAGVDVKFSSFDYTLNLSDLETKFNAAMEVIANKIDLDGLTLAASAAYNYVPIQGAPAPTSLQALQSILQVGQKLDENGAPRGSQRAMVLGPLGNTELMPGLQGYFNAQATLGEQYNDGIIADSLGFKFGMDQNVVTLTNGTQPATGGTVNGAGQTGSTLLVNTASITGTIQAGQKFTIANVFAVNPQNRQSTGSLQQFVVNTTVAAGATSLSISPAITPTGQFQNVTASPANTAGLTFGAASGAVQANIGFHRDAFTLACVPMATFGRSGVVDMKTETYKGISLRMIKFYDGVNDDLITRFDVLYGWASPYPELACVLGG